MFSKPFKIRACNRLKTSERKLLKDRFINTFPRITENKFTEFLSKKDSAVDLFKIKTHSNASVDVYVVNKVPTAFIYEGQLFPTVYFLWEYPECLISFTTFTTVVDKLRDGAHLMLPGVTHPTFNQDCPETPTFDRDTPVYVNVTTNKAAVAVGVTVESAATLCSQRNKGKCVSIYHLVNDNLCIINNLQPLPVPELGCSQTKIELIKTVNKLENSTTENENVDSNDNNYTEKEDSAQIIASEQDVMDRLLLRCLFTAMKYSNTLKLPILVSTFCNTYLKEACPALDITKSSYGKPIQFLQKCVEKELLEMDQEKGIYSITKVNCDHPSVQEFKYDPNDVPKITMLSDAPPIIAENCYTVTSAVLSIFGQFDFTSGSPIRQSQLQGYIVKYIRCNKLEVDGSIKKVRVNDALRLLLTGDNKHLDNVNLDIIKSSIVKKMNKSYVISIGGVKTFHKGELKPINITVASRCNGKTVTLVDNVEIYHINVEDLSKECQHGSATGVKINKDPKKPDQLQIQGNQVLFVHNILTGKYGVNKNYITGLEFAPKKKKK